MPQLAPMLGDTSFDAGNESRRFTHLFATDSRLGTSLAWNWAFMQREVGDRPDGVLQVNAAGAGGMSKNLQGDITLQREAVRFQALDVRIRALPANDVRRVCWLSLDSFSTAWVSSWPKQELYMSNAEFFEVSTRYLGLGSLACEQLAGERIAASRPRYQGDGCATAHGSVWVFRRLHSATRARSF